MEDGRSIDDVILQVFEEHADKFTFPLDSHKQARDFCRLLNRIGLTYEMMAEEVEEKKNYFENWRLISNEDNAIGEKVIKRLNRPLQDTMLIEDDADDDDAEVDKVKRLLFAGKSIDIDVDAEATLKALDEKRHKVALEALREAEENAEKEKCANEKNETKTKEAVIEKKEEKKKENVESKDVKNHVEPKAKDKVEDGKASDAKATAKLENETKDKSGSQSAKSELSAINGNASKVASKVENTAEKTTTSVKSSEPDKTPVKAVEKSPGSAPEKKVTSEKISADKKSAEKTPGESKQLSTSVDKKSVDSGSTVTATKSPQKSIASPPTSPTSPTSPAIKVDTTKVETSTKLIPESAKTTPAATKSEKTSDSDSKISKEPEQLSVKFSQPNAPLGAKSVNDKDSTNSAVKKEEKKDGIKWSDSSDSTSSSSGASSPVGASPSTPAPKAAVSPAATPLIVSAAPVSKPASVETASTSAESTPRSADVYDYDSDLDNEEMDKKSDQAKLIDSVNKYKASIRDGAGYIYILSDTTGSKPVEDLAGIHRVRIGASRFPQKRFEQAKTFNVDIRLVTSKHVTNRRAALTKIQEELSSMLYRGIQFWYRGSIEKILESLEGLI